jgi:hypothetical protein
MKELVRLYSIIFLSLAMLVGFSAVMPGTSLLTGCTPQARTTAIADGLKVALCVSENQDLPVEQVLVKCASENVSPSDITTMLENQKKATAAAAARIASASCNPQQVGARLDRAPPLKDGGAK